MKTTKRITWTRSDLERAECYLGDVVHNYRVERAAGRMDADTLSARALKTLDGWSARILKAARAEGYNRSVLASLESMAYGIAPAAPRQDFDAMVNGL